MKDVKILQARVLKLKQLLTAWMANKNYFVLPSNSSELCVNGQKLFSAIKIAFEFFINFDQWLQLEQGQYQTTNNNLNVESSENNLVLHQTEIENILKLLLLAVQNGLSVSQKTGFISKLSKIFLI